MSVYSTQPKTKEEMERQLRLIGDILEEHLVKAEQFESVDKESLVFAKASLQTGFLWFRKALENDNMF